MITIGGNLSRRLVSWKSFQICSLGHVHSRMPQSRSRSQTIGLSANDPFLTSSSRYMYECGTRSNNSVKFKLEVKYFSNVLADQSTSSEPLHSQGHHSSDILWMDTGTTIPTDHRRSNPMDIEGVILHLMLMHPTK